MTVLRSECRATLAWCLDQTEGFTQRECFEHFQIHQVAISKNFRRLEGMGVLRREKLKGNQCLFWVSNLPLAKELVEERPRPKNGYIPVTKRSNRAGKSARQTGWTGISSVFQMGGQS